MIVLDTGGVYAALDANETLHDRAVAALTAAKPPRVLSPFVLAELDCLIATRVGHRQQMALVDEVTRGVYQLEAFSSDDLGEARRLMQRYADLHIRVTDASVVVLANGHRTVDVLCTDERHFRALRGAGGKPFRDCSLSTRERAEARAAPHTLTRAAGPETASAMLAARHVPEQPGDVEQESCREDQRPRAGRRHRYEAGRHRADPGRCEVDGLHRHDYRQS
jgi:predicted nucleic acid-binding protein